MRPVFRVYIDINFRILIRTVLTVGIPFTLSSFPGVESPMALATCFATSIWHISEPVNFLSYLVRVSVFYTSLGFAMLPTYASQNAHILSYCGLLVSSLRPL